MTKKNKNKLKSFLFGFFIFIILALIIAFGCAIGPFLITALAELSFSAALTLTLSNTKLISMFLFSGALCSFVWIDLIFQGITQTSSYFVFVLSGKTHSAAKTMIQLLLKCGADINGPESDSYRMPLNGAMFALMHKKNTDIKPHTDMLRFLIEQGADIHCTKPFESRPSPLWFQLFSRLIDGPIHYDIPNTSKKFTPLDLAISGTYRGDISLVSLKNIMEFYIRANANNWRVPLLTLERLFEYENLQLIDYFFIEKKVQLRLSPEEQSQLLELAQTHNLSALVSQLQEQGIQSKSSLPNKLCSRELGPTSSTLPLPFNTDVASDIETSANSHVNNPLPLTSNLSKSPSTV